MLVTPRPGIEAANVCNWLENVHMDLQNLRTSGHPPYIRLLKYLNWASNAARTLYQHISQTDVDSLVLTRGHAALLASAGDLAQWISRDNGAGRMVGDLVDLEVEQRLQAFEDAISTLRKTLDRWTRPGWFVVADPSFYIQHPAPLADADLHAVLGLPGDEEIHLLFPIVVVDELDGLKEAGKARPRWRSLHTLGLLGSVLREDGTGILFPAGRPRPGTDSIRGAVTVEIVLDQPGHVRLPIADDEIIDRALAIQHLAGRDVHLLTGDTGQSTRGRAVGLKVHQIPAEDPGDEPDWAALRAAQDRAGTGTRAKRRARQEAEEAAAPAIEASYATATDGQSGHDHR